MPRRNPVKKTHKHLSHHIGHIHNTMQPFFKKTPVVALSIAVIAVGLAVWAFSAPMGQISSGQPARQKTAADKVGDAIATKDLASCDAFKGVPATDGADYYVICRNNIALTLAQEKHDPSYCDDLDGTLMSVSDCKRNVTVNSATGGDLSACSAIASSTMQTACVTTYWAGQATRAKDPTLCSHITDSNLAAACGQQVLVAELVQNPAAFSCDQLSGSLQSDCQLLQSAIKNKSIASCSGILDNRIRSACSPSAGGILPMQP